MPVLKNLRVIILCLLTMNSMGQDTTGKVFFSWSQAKPIPDADGFAGSYAGVSNGALMVAGGANFPGDRRPWTQGVKTWYDKVFILEKPDGDWKEIGKLPRPMGYGISLTWKNGFVCLGGGDAGRNYADAFILKYSAGKLATTSLPPMPACMWPEELLLLPGFRRIISGAWTSRRRKKNGGC